MRLTSAALALALFFLISPSGWAQGIPRSPAFVAGRAGWDAIREGRHEDAAAAFAKAVDAEPRDPSLHFGAGVSAFLLGQPTTARLSLERALALAPSMTAASLLLGDILYRGSDIDGALRVYEAAAAHAAGNAELTQRLVKLQEEAAAHRGYFASHGAHFTVLFEGPADEALAARAVDVLETAYWRVATALALYPEGQITVILYTQEQFRDITRSPEWAVGVYDGRIRIPVRGTLDSRELERVLTHEFTHALVRSVVPGGIPTWLHEGLAVAFEPQGENWARAQLSETVSRLPLSRLAKSFSGLATTTPALCA
jgi:tetratricopeptide (TPR) repeat protein